MKDLTATEKTILKSLLKVVDGKSTHELVESDGFTEAEVTEMYEAILEMSGCSSISRLYGELLG